MSTFIACFISSHSMNTYDLIIVSTRYELLESVDTADGFIYNDGIHTSCIDVYQKHFYRRQ